MKNNVKSPLTVGDISDSNWTTVRPTHALKDKELRDEMGLKPGTEIGYLPHTIKQEEKGFYFVRAITKDLIHCYLPLGALNLSTDQEIDLVDKGHVPLDYINPEHFCRIDDEQIPDDDIDDMASYPRVDLKPKETPKRNFGSVARRLLDKIVLRVTSE